MLARPTAPHHRVVLIGDSSVGKTAIVNRFLYDSFTTDQPNTIGVLHYTYSEERNGTQIQIQIWDTAGEERYRSLGPVYYRDASAGLVVFDLSISSTFTDLEQWTAAFKSTAAGDAIVIIVGNKLDLLEPGNSAIQEAKAWCESQGFQFFATSAKTGEGVAHVFSTLIGRIADRQRSVEDRSIVPEPEMAATRESDGCCS
jgi:small GTP-binding protein